MQKKKFWLYYNQVYTNIIGMAKKTIKNNVSNRAEKVISAAKKRWYTYVWWWISCLGDISFSYDTMFQIQRMNPEAQAAKDLIARMIGRKWIMFKKGWLLYEDSEWERTLLELFKDANTWSWKTFKDKYYTNYFCSGMVNAFYSTMGDGSTRVQVLDSRYVKKDFDEYLNITGIKYNWQELAINRTASQIVKYDPNRPGYWMSIYNTVVYDALSDFESAKRNYMFFRNGAMPNVILTMDDDIENEDEINAAIDQFEKKYQGTDQSHWVLALGWVKEVRTLDITNRDLELLDLRKFSIKVFGMLFWFDPRFLAFRDWENGSHSEYAQLAIQSDKTMSTYADVLEEFMLSVTRDLYPTFPYEDIELINDTFLDEATKIDMYKSEIQNWISTPAEVIKKLGKPTNNLSENMNKYYMNVQFNTIDGIVAESEARIKPTE